MAAFAATTDRIAVGSGVIDIWSCNPAPPGVGVSTLDDLAPGRILAGLGLVGPAGRQGRHLRERLRVMREVVDALRLLLRCDAGDPTGGVHSTWSNSTTSTRSRAQAGADLHRRHRHADDGAGRRDRRRRRPQLPGLPGLQRAGALRPRRRRRQGGALSTPSTGPSWSCARSTRTARPRRRRPPARHAVPGPAAAHHGGLGRAPRAWRTSAACSPGPPPTSKWWRRRSWCPTRSSRCCAPGRPPNAGPRWPSTWPPLHVADPLPLGDVEAMIDAFALLADILPTVRAGARARGWDRCDAARPGGGLLRGPVGLLVGVPGQNADGTAFNGLGRA